MIYIESNNLINPDAGFDSHKAQSLFNYAKKLPFEYADWDTSALINPELYSENDKDDIEKTNAIFQHAVAFILCHEFFHIDSGHISA